VAGTLVVSAWEPEIAPLGRLLRSATMRPAARPFQAMPVGVGAIDAAAGAMALLASVRPDHVIFIGTAGSYPRGRRTVGLGEVVVATDLFWASTAVLRGDGYLPEPAVSRERASAELGSTLAGAGRKPALEAAVACPTAITRSATLGRHIAHATGAAVENLEAFAVARAVALSGIDDIRFAAVLGIANRVGPSGHREWRAHHRAASHAACRLVAAFLRERQGNVRRST
jgi:nucleoside phosphorylase